MMIAFSFLPERKPKTKTTSSKEGEKEKNQLSTDLPEV